MWATKYRPKSFEDLMGQETTVKILKSAVAQPDKLPRAWLFYGAHGLGKTTLARIFAASILGIDVELLGQNLNYFEHNASTCSSVELLNTILESLMTVPWDNAMYRVVVIDEAHDLSYQAKDRLLSYLEEQTCPAIFILLTTEVDKLKPTLRGRCLSLPVRKVSTENIVERLKHICGEEGVSYDIASLRVIAQSADGHVRDAIRSLQQVSLLGEVSSATVNNLILSDVDQASLRILSCMALRWDEVSELLLELECQFEAQDLWKSIVVHLVSAYITKFFPQRGLDVHRQVAGWFSEDIDSLGEWCLLYGSRFMVSSNLTLLAGLGHLKNSCRSNKLGVHSSASDSKKKTISRRSLLTNRSEDGIASIEDIQRKIFRRDTLGGGTS